MAVSLLNGYLTLVSTADYTNAALKRRLWQVITFDSYLKVPDSNLDLVLLGTYYGWRHLIGHLFLLSKFFKCELINMFTCRIYATYAV